MTNPSSPLPRAYEAWMVELLGAPIPAETRATCDDCAMCGHVAPDASSFNPETKCCTYTPSLANFLVGRVLTDPDPDPAAEAGRASIRARIEAGVGVSPLGLYAPAVPRLLYRFGAAQGFGHSRALRCPHYIEAGGLCGIWRHRNAVCATWFCKHVRGVVARDFWERTQQFLTALEQGLTAACLLELGLDVAVLARLYARDARPTDSEGASLALTDLDGRPDAAERATQWGRWAGREEELYRACAAWVDGMSLADAVRHCGSAARVRAALVRAAWERLTEAEAPARLRPGKLQVVRLTDNSCRLVTYSVHDPVEMPRELLDVLHHFDGRTTEEALRAMTEAGAPELAPALVRKMVDFGVLVDVEGGAPPDPKA